MTALNQVSKVIIDIHRPGNILMWCLDVPGEVPDTVAWRRLLNGFSHNLYPTSTSHTSTEDKQDDYKYEECKIFVIASVRSPV